MLCPFCLGNGEIQPEGSAQTPARIHRCPHCREQVPGGYVREYRRYPPVVINAIGFRQHGKTVYFASLFYALKRLRLARHWPGFYSMALDEPSLETVKANVEMLEGGRLPDSTPKNFPRPTMVRVQCMPLAPDATLLFYDTGGECFERPTQLVQFASFVRRSHTAMFLISLPNLSDPSGDMHRLLETYVVGMGELGGDTRRQHLLVVFTKADEMIDRVVPPPELEGYLEEGTVDGLARPQDYVRRLHGVSRLLERFVRDELRADEFVNAAHDRFRSARYSMISALGARPGADGRLPVQVTPRRVLDPLVWLMEMSQPFWRQWRNRHGW